MLLCLEPSLKCPFSQTLSLLTTISSFRCFYASKVQCCISLQGSIFPPLLEISHQRFAFTYVGETVETVSDFIFLGSKITVDGDCSHEIKRHLLLGRKVMTNLDSILKSRDVTLPTKVLLVKAIQWSCMDMRVGLWTKLSAEKVMLLNCGVGEGSWESLGLQGDPTSPS